MLGVTSGSELFWNRRNWTVRKGNGMWIWIQLPFNENRMEILIKKQLSIYPEIIWNYVNISFHYEKIKNPHLNFESLSELKNLENEINLKRFLIKTAIYGGNDLYWKLTSTNPKNVKSISIHCRQFQLTIFLRQTTFRDKTFFITWSPPLLNFFLMLRVCSGFNVP